MARVPKHIIEALKEARQHAAYETARFGFPGDTVTVREHMYPERTENLDKFIKEHTRLHRESWILPAIDKLLAWAEGPGDVRNLALADGSVVQAFFEKPAREPADA